jgi:TRAP-type C4-dicarboxylate transport system permease small subunit
MKIVYLIAKYLEYVACAVLVILIMLTMVDVITGDFFHFPIKGTMEFSSFMLGTIMALGLCSAAVERRHIKVDLMMDHLPKKAQFVIDTAMLSVTSILLAIMTWANFKQAMIQIRYTSVLNIPDRPFRLVFVVCLGFLCICTVAVIIENFRKREEK